MNIPLTIEGIEVTDDECKTSANSQPNILINRSLVHDNTHSKCFCTSTEYVNFSLLISLSCKKRLLEHNLFSGYFIILLHISGSSSTNEVDLVRGPHSTSGLCIIGEITDFVYEELPFIFIGSKEEPNPSDIFRVHLDHLCDAFAANLDRISDSLFANGLIGEAVLQSTTIDGVSNYRKARQVVHELYNQLKTHSKPEQYLTMICDVLLKQNDQRLTDIVNTML